MVRRGVMPRRREASCCRVEVMNGGDGLRCFSPRLTLAILNGSADTAALEQDLADALGLKVALSDKGGKGELILSYRSLEQLDDLCRRLMRA